MKLFVRNTPHGLVPLYDDDYDEKKKLVIGRDYRVEVKLVRHLPFHRKYFAMLDAAWCLLTEKQRTFFGGATYGEKFGKEAFRKSVQITAGLFEPIYDGKEKRWQKSVRSIAFENMDEAEFEKAYQAVYDTVMGILSANDVTQEQFERMIENFQ